MCLKKLFCTHEFHKLTSFKVDADLTVGYKVKEIFVIYCPKCKKQKKVEKYKYECIMEKQELDKEYEDGR